jgi:hypothetical protein
MQRMVNNDQPYLKMRACRSSLIVIQIIFVLLSLLGGWDAVMNPTQPSIWFPVIHCLSILIFIQLWLGSFEVEVKDGVLRYSTLLRYSKLLRKTKSVRLEDIKSAKTEVGEKRYRDRFRPFIRLVIRYQHGTSTESFDINAKVFSLDDLRQLSTLLDNCVAAHPKRTRKAHS